VLFRTASTSTVWGSDLGWSRHAARPLEIVEVPGDHETILSQVEVPELAARLATTLESLDRP